MCVARSYIQICIHCFDLNITAERQGEQIGTLFALWVIVYFGQLFANNLSTYVAQIFLYTFSAEKSFVHMY
jgi:hypothetical protein